MCCFAVNDHECAASQGCAGASQEILQMSVFCEIFGSFLYYIFDWLASVLEPANFMHGQEVMGIIMENSFFHWFERKLDFQVENQPRAAYIGRTAHHLTGELKRGGGYPRQCPRYPNPDNVRAAKIC